MSLPQTEQKIKCAKEDISVNVRLLAFAIVATLIMHFFGMGYKKQINEAKVILEEANESYLNNDLFSFNYWYSQLKTSLRQEKKANQL